MDENAYKAPQPRKRLRVGLRILGFVIVIAWLGLSLPTFAYPALAVVVAAIALSLLVGLIGTYFALRTRPSRADKAHGNTSS
jgi:hypothetical protein